MKTLILTLVFTVLSSYAFAGEANEDCWEYADRVENYANKGEGATYASFYIWEAVYNYCQEHSRISEDEGE